MEIQHDSAPANGCIQASSTPESGLAVFYKPHVAELNPSELTLTLHERTYDSVAHRPGPDQITVINWAELGIPTNVALGVSALSLFGAISGSHMGILANSLVGFNETGVEPTLRSYLGKVIKDHADGRTFPTGGSFVSMGVYLLIGGLVPNFPKTFVSILDFITSQKDLDPGQIWEQLSTLADILDGLRMRVLAVGESVARHVVEKGEVQEALLANAGLSPLVDHYAMRIIDFSTSIGGSVNDDRHAVVVEELLRLVQKEVADGSRLAIENGVYRTIKTWRIVTTSSKRFDEVEVRGILRTKNTGKGASVHEYSGDIMSPLDLHINGRLVRLGNPAGCPAFKYGYHLNRPIRR